MALSSQHITGFIVGLGVAAGGYLAYKQNQAKVDEFLKTRGITLPSVGETTDPSSMSLEDLVRQKERFEDLIAEKEYAASEKVEDKPQKTAAKAKS